MSRAQREGELLPFKFRIHGKVYTFYADNRDAAKLKAQRWWAQRSRPSS